MSVHVGIINLGAGNVGAIVNRLSELGVTFRLIEEPTLIEFSHIILPGVGNFDDFMTKLENKGLRDFMLNRAQGKAKIMGICIGMHALASDSEEGYLKGLGLIPGSVKKMKSSFPLPHMGWNSTHIANQDLIIDGLDNDVGFYYLHNYKFIPVNDCDIVAYSEYEETIAGVVKNKNIYGVQFHPEKSHDNGLIFFRNFLDL
jgi:imidazole glycerol-phosphate synthase subunit HisH